MFPAPESAGANPRPPSIWLADDLAVIRADVDDPSARAAAIAAPGGTPLRLAALRDETVAFQVIVEAGDAPLAGVEVDVGLPAPLETARYVEHYLPVRTRSRSPEARRALSWAPAARPDDDDVLGLVPDALIPVALAPAWHPYPLAVPAGQRAAVWIDVYVPVDAPAGVMRGTVVIEWTGGAPLMVPIELEVSSARLPYRAASVLIAYSRGELRSRLPGADIDAAERQLWQLLHAAGADAFADLSSPDDVRRLAGALDGSWFTAGPGAGVPPAAAAIGLYGSYGDATPETLAQVAAVVPLVPAGIELLLYAVDEECDSPLGPRWRRALASSPVTARVMAAHTCSTDPTQQDVDLAIVTSDQFQIDTAAAARAHGQRVWVYNGSLPRAPALVTDGPPSSMAALGWIAAAHAVDRWFLWEATFWNDDNPGGHGPVDLWQQPETFHNRWGDTALGDGLLVYPLERDVVPSMRLYRLRRGLQDAALIALAHRADTRATGRIVARALPAALDELADDGPRAWDDDGAHFAAARAELRQLIPAGASLDAAGARAELAALASERRDARPRGGYPALAAMVICGGLFLIGAAFSMRRAASRR